jgi:subtilisin family serine protease
MKQQISQWKRVLVWRSVLVVLVVALTGLSAGCSDAARPDGVQGGGSPSKSVTAPAQASGAGAPANAALQASQVYTRAGGAAHAVARKRLNRVRGAAPGHYIVVLEEPSVLKQRYAAPVPRDVMARLGQRFAFRGRQVFDRSFLGFSAEMSEADAIQLAADADVAYVVEDVVVRHMATQTNAPWGLDRIDQRELVGDGSYTTTLTGSGVHAYVIDSGVLPSHQELAGRVTIDLDVVGDAQKGVDCDGHGTHVAGTLAGTTYGVAKQARIHALRVLDCQGMALSSDVIAALEWTAVNHQRPAVVNMSLGGGQLFEMDQAVRDVVATGVTVVVAAGNTGFFADDISPARVTEAITVGASDGLDARSQFSSFGRPVDVFAPGSSVVSSWFATTTATAALSGTSMASPHVAGVAALYLQANPNASPAQVEAAIIASSTRGKLKDVGTGSPNRLLFSGLTPPTARPALLVVGNLTLSSDDAALRARLESLGFVVSLKTGAGLVSADANGKAVVVVSATVDSPTVGTKLTNVSVPVVTLEGYLVDDLKLTGATLNTDYGQLFQASVLEVRDELSPLAAGLRGNFSGGVWDHQVQVSTGGGRYWGVPAATAIGLDGRPVTLTANSGRAAIYGYEVGATMIGMTAPARRVAFFADEAAVRTLTAEGWAMFDAAVDWASAPVLPGPEAFGLRATASTNRVQLDWFARGENLRHEIRRSTRPGGPYTLLTTTTGGGVFDPDFGIGIYQFIDTTAVNGQTYHYVVTPLDTASRPGRATFEASATLGLPGPAWVVIMYQVTGEGGLVSIDVNSDAPGAATLRISRGTSSAGPFTPIATVPANPPLGIFYQDFTAVANQPYYYTVQAINAFGEGPVSEPTLGYFDGIGQSATLQNLILTSVPNGVRAIWDHVPLASDYNVVVFRQSDGQLVYLADVTEPDVTVWLDPNDLYQFIITPGGSFVGGLFPAVAFAVPGTGSALLVTGPSASLRAGDQALAAELEALGYVVTVRRSSELVTADAGGKDVVVISSTATPADVGTKLTDVFVPIVTLEPFVLGHLKMTGTTPGTSFGVSGNQSSFVVDSEHELGGNGLRTAKMSARLGDFGWGVPTSSAISIARLPGATPVSGIAPRAEFAYEAGSTMAGGFVTPARRLALLIDADAITGLTFDGREILQAGLRWAVDPAARDPRVPTGLSAVQSGSSVQLNWPAVPGASSYTVMRANMALNVFPPRARIVEVIGTGITGTSFSDPAAFSGGSYQYYVASVGATGGSPRSEPVWGGVNVPPADPSLAAAGLNGAAKLAIKAGALTSNLRVLRASQSGGPYTVIASNLPASTTTFTASGLTNGVMSFFAVEGTNAFGVSRSLEAYALPSPTPSSVSGLAATAGNGSVALSWAAVANVRGYRVGRSAGSGSSATDIVAAETTLTNVTDVNVPNGQALRYYLTPLGGLDVTGPTVSFTVTPRGKALLVRAATPSAGDNVIRDRLVTLGFDVTEKSDTQLVTSDANGVDLVVVTETVTSGNVNTKLTNVPTPVLSMEPSILDDLGMTGLGLGTDFGTVGGQTQLNLVDVSHPMARLLSGVRTVNTTGGNYSFGIPGSEALLVGSIVPTPQRAGLFGYQTGSNMVNLSAPGRRVALFVDSLAAASLTTDGRSVFDAAVAWAAGNR